MPLKDVVRSGVIPLQTTRQLNQRPGRFDGSVYHSLQEPSKHLERMWSVGLKGLLESKHLYQKVALDPRPYVDGLMKALDPPQGQFFLHEAEELIRLPLSCGRMREMHEIMATHRIDGPVFYAVNTQMYCRQCRRREAFRPIV
jgi:hypothetical protein